MNLLSWNDYRYNLADDGLFSGIVIKGSLTSTGENLALYNISDYINTLPGYNAQVLTFSVMIIFLIIIVSIVLGIFIYVLTIQKTSMFGVMKAQGISNFYISSSVIFQTLTLVALGISFGLALTLISGFFLQSILPFAINISFYIVISLAFFLFFNFWRFIFCKCCFKNRPAYRDWRIIMLPLIEMQNVTKDFIQGDNIISALKPTNFKAYGGQLIGIIGPSGSGKSTFLTILGGLQKPTTGRVLINGEPFSDLESKAKSKNSL